VHLGEGEGGKSARAILDRADALGRTVRFEEHAGAVILADQATTVEAGDRHEQSGGPGRVIDQMPSGNG
jgi:hypothetical protein